MASNNQMLNYYADGRQATNQPNQRRVNDRQYEQEFRQLDKNNDGVLTYDEIHGRGPVVDPVKPYSPKKPSPKTNLTEEEAIFKDADRNCDGFIDFGEYAAAKNRGSLGGLNHTAPYPNPSRREFRITDTKQDNKIDWDEFIAARKKGLLGGRVTTARARDDCLDSNIWSVVGLLLSAIFFFALGGELNDRTPNYHLSREFGYVAAVGFCIYLVGMMFSAGGDWCSTPVEDRGCAYFAKLFVISGAVGLATVMWGLALGFTMNMSTGGERNLVESCSYILGISCFFIAIGRVLKARLYRCTQIIAWFAFTIMAIIGIFFMLFGSFYGDGEDEKGTYSVICHVIGALLLIYIIILIIDMVKIRC